MTIVLLASTSTLLHPHASTLDVRAQVLEEMQLWLADPPGFVVGKLYDDAAGTVCIQLRRVTSEEAASMKRESLDSKKEELAKVCGFSRVLELCAQSGKPGVGHNCMLDLLVGDVPEKDCLQLMVCPAGEYQVI